MWNGVTFCCGQVGTWGNLCVTAQSAASHPQAVLWVSYPAMGALCSPGCGDLGVCGSLGHSWARLCHLQSPLQRGGSRGQEHAVSPGHADVLRPLSLPSAFSPHPTGLLLRPPSCPFFFVWGWFFHQNLISTL